jgi:hypothetical protein
MSAGSRASCNQRAAVLCAGLIATRICRSSRFSLRQVTIAPGSNSHLSTADLEHLTGRVVDHN